MTSSERVGGIVLRELSQAMHFIRKAMHSVEKEALFTRKVNVPRGRAFRGPKDAIERQGLCKGLR